MREMTMEDVMHPSAQATDTEFPYAPRGWTRAEAERAAASEGLEMDEDRWRAIRALQALYARRPADARLNVRQLHDALDERFHAQGGLRYVYALFPRGPVAQGCRLAGLEPPAGAEDKGFGSVM